MFFIELENYVSGNFNLYLFIFLFVKSFMSLLEFDCPLSKNFYLTLDTRGMETVDPHWFSYKGSNCRGTEPTRVYFKPTPST